LKSCESSLCRDGPTKWLRIRRVGAQSPRHASMSAHSDSTISVLDASARGRKSQTGEVFQMKSVWRCCDRSANEKRRVGAAFHLSEQGGWHDWFGGDC